MDKLNCSRLLAMVLASSLMWPASAASLYKVVDSDGAIVFTDVPPPADAGTVSEIPIAETTGVPKPPGLPRYENTIADEAVARANVRIDLAEHALAMARQGLSSPRDGLSLATERTRSGDRARVDFYKRDVQLARQQLMDLLRQRQVLPVLATR